MRYDVVVVGAGPAGSTVARECAERNLSVLLLDRAAFPRDKPCGGGVNVRTARLLPFDLAPVTERIACGVHISICRSRSYTRWSQEPLTYLTQRRHLDALLAQRAADAGAEFRQQTAVQGVERRHGSVAVATSDGTFEGRALVAADGANGKTARLAGVPVQRDLALALEGNISPRGGVSAEWQSVLGLDLGDVPGGYGWIFPKGDHVNVGVGGWPALGPTFRPRLAELARYYGLDPDAMWGVKGHHIPMYRPETVVAEGNVLVVGDAAGLADPLTLEGIYGAVWSGQRAAHHLARYLGGESATLRGYQRDLERDIFPELRMARQVYDLSYLVGLARCMWLVRDVDRAWDLLWRLLRGEQTYLGARRRLGPLGYAFEAAPLLLHRIPRRRTAYVERGSR